MVRGTITASIVACLFALANANRAWRPTSLAVSKPASTCKALDEITCSGQEGCTLCTLAFFDIHICMPETAAQFLPAGEKCLQFIMKNATPLPNRFMQSSMCQSKSPCPCSCIFMRCARFSRRCLSCSRHKIGYESRRHRLLRL
jgi:hypothetical protein